MYLLLTSNSFWPFLSDTKPGQKISEVFVVTQFGCLVPVYRLQHSLFYFSFPIARIVMWVIYNL